ncbi:MAG: prenyltransferase [Chloroflexi bacterium]|nr:prenyltransferase [Chloroflexota bacterium]
MLSVMLAFLGVSIAWHDGIFHPGYALLAFLGLLLAHISVNVLNDYFDYKSGLDLKTQRTPFSGGSGVLPASLLTPKQVFWLGTGSLMLAIPIGIYFVIVKGWLLLPLLLISAVCILIYTPLILKTRWPEWAAGLGLGTLPVLGTYFAQAGHYPWHVVVASVPSGILVSNLLLLNEFPDAEADSEVGRKTTPVVAGKSNAGIVYSILTLLVYLWIIGIAFMEKKPILLIGLLTLPFAIKAVRGALRYQDAAKLMPAMASNVMVVLLTQLFLGIGYVLAGVL